MSVQQENFENSVILESELTHLSDSRGEYVPVVLEELTCNTLSEIQLERGMDLTDEERDDLNIYVWFKMSKLTKLEKEIAKMYFIEGRSLRYISNNIKTTTTSNRRSSSTPINVSKEMIRLHIKKISEKLSDGK